MVEASECKYDLHTDATINLMKVNNNEYEI